MYGVAVTVRIDYTSLGTMCWYQAGPPSITASPRRTPADASHHRHRHPPTLLQAVLSLPCGAAIDAWSVGVLLAEAALRHPLLQCRAPAEALQAVSGNAA